MHLRLHASCARKELAPLFGVMWAVLRTFYSSERLRLGCLLMPELPTQLRKIPLCRGCSNAEQEPQIACRHPASVLMPLMHACDAELLCVHKGRA